MSMSRLQTQLTRQLCRNQLSTAVNSRSVSMFGFGSSGNTSKVKESYSTAPPVTSSPSEKPKMETINKRSICEEVATTHELSMAQSERIVNTVLDTIVEAVVDGKKVRISNFGIFDAYMTKETRRVNPQTGEPLLVSPKTRIRFAASSSFKNACQK